METKTVKYSDLFLVSFLSIKGHAVFATEKNQENRIEFIFEDNEALRHDVTSFLEDDPVTVRMRAFSKRYKDFTFYVHSPQLLRGTFQQIEKGA